MKAIVLGSTGLVGGELTRLLAEESSIEHILLLNRREAGLSHPKITEKIVDFGDIKSFETEIQGDYLFCCLGTTIKKAQSKEAFRRVDLDLPLEFAEIFSKKNHRAFAVVSALGASSRSPFFYSQVKGDLEQELKGLPLNKLVIVRPSLLLGEREEKRTAEDLGQKLAPLLSKLLPKKYRPAPAREVAKTLIDLALGRPAEGGIDVEVVS